MNIHNFKTNKIYKKEIYYLEEIGDYYEEKLGFYEDLCTNIIMSILFILFKISDIIFWILSRIFIIFLTANLRNIVSYINPMENIDTLKSGILSSSFTDAAKIDF